MVWRIEHEFNRDAIKDIHNSLITSAVATEMMANEYREVGRATTATMEQHVNPAVDELRAAANDLRSTIADIKAPVISTISSSHQLLAALEQESKSISDATVDLLHNVSGLLTSEDIRATLVALRQAGVNVHAITNDPAIVEIIRNIEATTSNLNQTSAKLSATLANVEAVTEEIKGKVQEILHPPKPQGFWGKTRYYVMRVLGIIRGTGNLVHLILQILAA